MSTTSRTAAFMFAFALGASSGFLFGQPGVGFVVLGLCLLSVSTVLMALVAGGGGGISCWKLVPLDCGAFYTQTKFT